MDLKYHFKDKLHNAILLEGNKLDILPKVFEVLDQYDFSIVNNPDFFNLSLDVLKMEDAINLKEVFLNKSFNDNNKRVFVVSINGFLLEAQNTMLKVFEEMSINHHLFLIIPNIDNLLPTLVSRFYIIKEKDLLEDFLLVKNFYFMNLNQKFLFLKDFLKSDENEDGDMLLESSHTKALKFLNKLEQFLYEEIFNFKINKDSIFLFEHMFNIRKYLRQPGSASKTLMESVAILLPKK